MEKKNVKLLTDEEKMKTVLDNYNDIAKKYAIEFKNDYSDIKYVDKFLSGLSGKKVLDVGCGIGRECKYVGEKGFYITGIDFSKEIIEEAKKIYPSGKFEVKDLTKMNYPEKSFDGLIFINTLFHIPESKLEETFEGCSRVMEKNGKMLLIFQEGDKELLEEEPLKKENLVYMHHYSFKLIEKNLKKHNLKIDGFEREETYDPNCPIDKKLILYFTKI